MGEAPRPGGKAAPYGNRWGYRLTLTGREKVRQTRQQRERPGDAYDCLA